MATEIKTLPEGWGVSGRITAAADTAVLVSNTDDYRAVYWWVTDDDTVPAVAVAAGHVLPPRRLTRPRDSALSMTLKTGERLWLAGEVASFDVTVTTGDA